MKVLSVFGTRPEAIKMAPVVKGLERHPERFVSRVCVTAQYRQMLHQVLNLFEIRPDYDLDIMQESQTLSQVTAEVFARLDPVIAAALVTFYHRVKVGHVEAGLWSFNRRMPEEINRVLTDHISALLFCPTETAVHNLAAEGITQGVHNVGDVMVDAVLHNVGVAGQRSRIPETLGLQPGRYLLATVHRPDNTDNQENLRSILAAFDALDEVVVFPTHPRVRKAAGTTVRIAVLQGYYVMTATDRHGGVGIAEEDYQSSTREPGGKKAPCPPWQRTEQGALARQSDMLTCSTQAQTLVPAERASGRIGNASGAV